MVVGLETVQLALQVELVREEHVVEIFAADRADPSFDKRMSLYRQLHPALTVQNDVSA
jgi:hypothetical protein